MTVEPISQDDPCGEALDYDLDFLDLEILARGKPERQTGGSISPAQRPDWTAVAELAERLTERAHDVRLEIYLARAALDLEGPQAMAVRLNRLALLIDTFWQHLHPCPEDDEDDETVRLNAIGDLVNPDGLMADLRDREMVVGRRSGSFSFRDWTSARFEEGSDIDLQQIIAALAETDSAVHDASAQGLRDCVDALGRIETAVRNHVPPQDAPKLVALATLLSQMLEALAPYLSEPAPAAAPAEAGGDAAAAGGAAAASAPRGTPQSRDDIVTMLDRICAWYRMHEPASPVPALLERARQLVNKDFLALLEELAPDGAAQFRHLAGLKEARPDT